MKYNLLKLSYILVFLFIANSMFAQKVKEPKMIFVEGGTFTMGSKDGENDGQPVHEVVLESFYISKTEITFAQYYQFCDDSGWPKPEIPIWGDNPNFPVVNVSWKDAGAYALWLSRKTGKNYRVPSEAEWEYAARGGQKSQKFIYSGTNDLENYSWFYETTYSSSAQPVETKLGNELDISDMSGNVWEWCKDSYSWKYYIEKDDKGLNKALEGGNYRVIRGGGWDSEANRCRIANRDRDVPESKKDNLGFRVVYTE